MLAAVCVMALAGCQSGPGSAGEPAKEPSAEEVVTAVADALDLPESGMTMLETDKIFDLYSLDREKTADAAAYIDGSRSTACEVTVIKVKDAADVQMAQKAADVRIEDQTFSYQNYNPEQMVKIEGAVVYTKGNYVILVMADDTSKVKETFEALV